MVVVSRQEALTVARNIEKQAEHLRIMVSNAEMSAGERETLKYCGALLTIASSTICDVVARAKESELFALGKTNGVLREWGLDELVGHQENA